MSNEKQQFYPSEELRAAALEADRQTEEKPLAGDGQRHYTGEAQRQAALAGAEPANIARAAGELGMTSDEWQAKRVQLGRPPTTRDV